MVLWRFTPRVQKTYVGNHFGIVAWLWFLSSLITAGPVGENTYFYSDLSARVTPAKAGGHCLSANRALRLLAPILQQLTHGTMKSIGPRPTPG